MSEFEAEDAPDRKRARLDLEDGASEAQVQPPRERIIVAPAPSTSKALKSVLKGASAVSSTAYQQTYTRLLQR